MARYPKIPKNPVTLWINGWLTDRVLDGFFEAYLPSWEKKITSGYRDKQDQELLKQKGLKPATYSAHLYNLARDFVLVNKKSGEIATDAQMRKIFTQYIKPNWEGYAYYGAKNAASKTGWIHVNLDRGITDITTYAGMGLTAIVLAFSANSLIKKLKEMKGRK